MALNLALIPLFVRVLAMPFTILTPVIFILCFVGVFATTDVLRSADPDTRILSCHTDSRSPKVIQLAEDSRFSWHFYDRDAKIQLRAYGNAWTHQGDTLASQRWQDGAWRSAQCYRTPLAPGASCTEADLDIIN